MVHQVIVGPQQEQFLDRSTANEDDQGRRAWKDFLDPGSKACLDRGLVEQRHEENNGARDLGLVLCWPPVIGIEIHGHAENGVQVLRIEYFLMDVVGIGPIGIAVPFKPIPVDINMVLILDERLPRSEIQH